MGLAEFGDTYAGIIKRAKRDGWGRDLTSKIRAKADALVSRAEVSSKVSTQKLDIERVLVEADAPVRNEAVRSEVRTESATATERLTVEVEAQTLVTRHEVTAQVTCVT